MTQVTGSESFQQLLSASELEELSFRRCQIDHPEGALLTLRNSASVGERAKYPLAIRCLSLIETVRSFKGSASTSLWSHRRAAQ